MKKLFTRRSVGSAVLCLTLCCCLLGQSIPALSLDPVSQPVSGAESDSATAESAATADALGSAVEVNEEEIAGTPQPKATADVLPSPPLQSPVAEENSVSSEEESVQTSVFPGLPQGVELTAEQMAEKQAMAQYGEAPAAAAGIEGVDYTVGTVLCLPDSYEQAQQIAAAYGAQLLNFSYGVALIRLPEGVTVAQALAAAADPSTRLPAVSADWLVSAAEADDPFLSASSDNYQWYHELIGSEAAWAITTGSPDVTVAVVDAGIDASHTELAGKVSSRTNYSFGSSVGMHGTHVAGLIAAEQNNGEGGSGLAPETTLIDYQVLSSGGTGSSSILLRALNQAIADHVNIINLSLGFDQYSSSVQKAIETAYENGIIVIAAAGNDGSTAATYPAAYEHVIAVAATDANGDRAAFSDYGDWISIAAPGVEMWSTGLDGDYSCLSGTSQAAPLVSGAAALYLSVAGDGKGDINGDGVRNGADVDAFMAALAATATPSADSSLGAGVLNVGALIASVATATPTPSTTASASPTATATVPVSPSATATTRPTASASPTATASATATTSASPTATATASASPTATASASPTATATASASPTATATASASPTATASPSETATTRPTASASPTATATASASPTATASATATATATASASPTATATASATVTASATATASASPTATASPSATATTRPTASASPLATVTAATTPTATASASPTATASATATATASASPMATASPSATTTTKPTASASPTATATASASPTATASPSATTTTKPTASASPTAIATASASPLATVTAATQPTATASVSPTATASATATTSASPTATATASASPLATVTAATQPTATASVSPTATTSASPTATASPSATTTTKPTASASPLATVTAATTPTATTSASPAATASATATTSAAPTATATASASPAATATSVPSGGTTSNNTTTNSTTTNSTTNIIINHTAVPSSTAVATATPRPTAVAVITNTTLGTRGTTASIPMTGDSARLPETACLLVYSLVGFVLTALRRRHLS